MATSTPAKDSKRSRDEVLRLNPTSANPEKKVCADDSFTSMSKTTLSDDVPLYVPFRMHPDDIVRIANELKTLMMPDLTSLVS